MTLDDFIKEPENATLAHTDYKAWFEKLWQAAHSEGEKVGWEKRQQLMKLLAVAVCPNCDGSGAKQISETDCQQCQWCDEKNTLLAAIDARNDK